MPRKPKCLHEELLIEEYGGWATEHLRENGEWSHNNTPGHYEATIYVECRTCKKAWRYSRYHCPKWLKRYLDEINI